tara:strand:+ start:254 stop:529 length:276 start_codon:yes stop_codon:yes gene_type:complete
MSTESLNRTSDTIENPSQFTEKKNNIVELDVLKQKAEVIKVPSKIRNASKRVNIEILKQRLYEEKKKEKVKRTIILSSVIVSLGALTMLTY